MVIPTTICPSDTSTSSELDDLSFEEKRVQIFSKQMLHGKLFVGIFQETRYVDSLNSYRDVVSLAKDEQELIQNLLAVKQRIENLYSIDHWIGITTPDIIGTPASYSIWVELPEGTVFGKYWFKIKKIKFNAKETCLRIKIIRPVDQEPSKNNSEYKEKISNNDMSNIEFFETVKEEAKEKFVYIIQNVATIGNFIESIKFLCTLLATCIVLLFEVLRYLCEFLIRFMKEFSNFMKSVTPIFQILANLVERLFRIFTMLIAYLFKGPNAPPAPPQQYYPHLNYGGGYNTRALPAPSRRRGVIIEEVE